MSTLLNAALDYAAREGWKVLPCLPRSKEPATAHGFYDATSEPETLRHHWGRCPHLNIAIATGAASGFWVLDVDGPEGKASLAGLEAEQGPLPATRTSITRSGYHLLFAYSGPLSSSAGRVAPQIDVRADGGYVLVAPSVHPTGHIYAWIDPSYEIVTAPDWLIRLAQRKITPGEGSDAPSPGPSTSRRNDGRYGRVALDAELARLRETAPGGRNDALNRAAFSLYQLIGGGEIDQRGIDELLIDACRSNGLVKDDGLTAVKRTIRSGASAGRQHPRRRVGP